MKQFSPKKLKRMGENRRHMLERMTDAELHKIASENQDMGHEWLGSATNRDVIIAFILACEALDPEANWSDLA